MRVTRVLLLLALALVATTQLPVTHGHAAVHDHHKHHDRHGHGEGHAHGHDHHGHKDHDHAHKHPHDHGNHQHHEHGEVEAAHAHAHDHHHDHQSPASKATTQSNIDRFSPRIWAEALFATALVGAAPVVILLFVPLGRGSVEAQKPLLRVFLSFAAGGLLGDALLHLLPHSLPTGGHDHSHDHDHGEGHGHSHSLQDLAVWLYCLAGMMAFLMLEKFVRAQTGDGHGHSHVHPPVTSHTPPTSSTTSEGEGLRQRKKKLSEEKAKEETEEDDDNDNGKTKGNQPPRIAAAGYLNLAADFSHNFTDGLAIGATFLRGSGWQTTVAMLLHEVPHEIGDFAILIQSGFTRREAMLTQLGTALGAMAGTVLGLLIEGSGDSGSAWISPFTAGGFIYIACASVMPELLEDCSLVQSLKEGVAMCLGIGLMVVIALYE